MVRCPVRMNADGVINPDGKHRCIHTTICIMEMVDHIKEEHTSIDKETLEKHYKTEQIGAGAVWITKYERKRLLKVRMARKIKTRHEAGPWNVTARVNWWNECVRIT